MQVIATAGHVDHGKSALVRALTGMEPDRWAEERRRGLTIDLGFAWMTLPDGERLAFVDVPGHERFVPNMLAGVGAVPAVLVVVAADGGWMPQSAEKAPQAQGQGPASALPPQVIAGVRAVLADLADAPFMAPEAGRLRELGLDGRASGAAVRAGLLLRVTEQIVLAPGAEAQAARVLAGLPQPFTVAEARQALGTTRRVAIPLLEFMDRAGITQRLPDDRRRVRLRRRRRIKSGFADIGRLCPSSAQTRMSGGPGFPFFPPIPPETSGWRYDMPNRYLVYG
jgi:hypothetical protein